MLEIFYYIDNTNLNDILNYGIKLSENYSKKITINTEEKLCLTGLLNPKDDITKFNSDDFTCVRLLLDNLSIKVAESSLYNTKLYNSTITSISDYRLGTYMFPEVLIFQSILPENIEVINYEIDYPLLYDNSKDLYTNNLIETLSLKLPNANDIILSALLEKYSKNENMNKETFNNINVFLSENNKQMYFSKKE